MTVYYRPSITHQRPIVSRLPARPDRRELQTRQLDYGAANRGEIGPAQQRASEPRPRLRDAT